MKIRVQLEGSDDTLTADVETDVVLDMINSVGSGEQITVSDKKGRVKRGSSLSIENDDGDIVYEITARGTAGENTGRD